MDWALGATCIYQESAGLAPRDDSNPNGAQSTRTNGEKEIAPTSSVVSPYRVGRFGFGPQPIGASFSLTINQYSFRVYFSSSSSINQSSSISTKTFRNLPSSFSLSFS